MLHSYYLNEPNNTEKYKKKHHPKLHLITWTLDNQADISLFNVTCTHVDTYIHTSIYMYVWKICVYIIYMHICTYLLLVEQKWHYFLKYIIDCTS